MFQLSNKLAGAKIVMSWVPDSDFLPDGVTFLNPAVSIEVYKFSPVKDPDVAAMLSGSPQLSLDSKSILQLVIGGVRGCKYELEFIADFSDGVQRDGVLATFEVE